MMGENLLQFSEITLPSDIKDASAMYIVVDSQDRRLALATLRGYILGTSATDVVKGSDTISLGTSGGRQTLKISDLERRLFGDKEFKEVNDELIILSQSGTDRGFVKLSTVISTLLPNEELVTQIVEDDTVFRIYDTKNKKYETVQYSTIETHLFGNTAATTVRGSDKINIKFENGEKRYTTTSAFKDYILPKDNFKADTEVDANLSIFGLRVDGGTDKRGYTTLNDIQAWMFKDLSIPKFTGTSFSKDVSILWKDSDKYGVMSPVALRNLIFPSDVITLDDTVVLHASKGDVSGVISLKEITETVMVNVNAKYGIDPDNKESNINDGDGLIFITNGAEKGSVVYKNISFLTLKNKVLDVDTKLPILPTTKIYCENGITESGYITYADLREQIRLDVFG